MELALRKGARVQTLAGPGTVTDHAHGESLVQLDTGSELDRSHGRWIADQQLTVTGFDPDALVWTLARRVPAGTLPPSLAWR